MIYGGEFAYNFTDVALRIDGEVKFAKLRVEKPRDTKSTVLSPCFLFLWKWFVYRLIGGDFMGENDIYVLLFKSRIVLRFFLSPSGCPLGGAPPFCPACIFRSFAGRATGSAQDDKEQEKPFLSF